ncbi:MAG: dihydroneopterin triphosphate diphosphatase [Acidiferrobacterales bacterium]|nr:dihydroneopterin triphosphate diphosphatase [Acidiferrobacterales bacterium]
MLVVVYTDNEVLLIKRADHDNFWQSVTGSLEWGETAQQAATRELTEETGISDVLLRDTGIRRSYTILEEWRARYHPDVRRNIENLFYCYLPDRCEINLNPPEHSEFNWLSYEEAKNKAYSWSNRLAIASLV